MVWQFFRSWLIFSPLRRSFATEAEAKIKTLLKSRFPNAESIEISDMSGGCGAMYQIYVKSKDFADMTVLAQHRLIKETLKDEIKLMHGLTIVTEV